MNQAEKMINMCNDKIVYFTEKLDNIWEELDKETKNLDKFKSSDCWDDPPSTSINVKNLSKVEKKQENKYHKKEVTRRNGGNLQNQINQLEYINMIGEKLTKFLANTKTFSMIFCNSPFLNSC